jgi:hypothetical protein
VAGTDPLWLPEFLLSHYTYPMCNRRICGGTEKEYGGSIHIKNVDDSGYELKAQRESTRASYGRIGIVYKWRIQESR